MPEGSIWDPGIQTIPRDRLLALQQERLREAVATAARLPFWRRKLEGAGLAPDDVKSADDLVNVPRTVKDELRASQAGHPPYGDYQTTEGAVRLGTTTGTTGAPTFVVWTRNDLAVEHEAAARNWWRYGVRPGWTIVHSHPLGIYGGGAILSSALEYFGCMVVAVGAPATDDQAEQAIRVFQQVKPGMYMMFDAAQLKFWEAAERLGVDPASIGMRMRADHPVLQSATGTAGAECFSFMGGACQNFNGAHLAEDYVVVECVDPQTGAPLPDGERGHLVVTTLPPRDNLMIRYDLEDVIRLDTAPCACGETHKRMYWDGRAKDVVEIEGKRILPVDVWWVLEDFPELKQPTMEYLVVRRPKQGALEIRVEGEAEYAPKIAPKLEERLEVPARVEMVPRGAIPRSDFKPVRVTDEP